MLCIQCCPRGLGEEEVGRVPNGRQGRGWPAGRGRVYSFSSDKPMLERCVYVRCSRCGWVADVSLWGTQRSRRRSSSEWQTTTAMACWMWMSLWRRRGQTPCSRDVFCGCGWVGGWVLWLLNAEGGRAMLCIQCCPRGLGEGEVGRVPNGRQGRGWPAGRGRVHSCCSDKRHAREVCIVVGWVSSWVGAVAVDCGGRASHIVCTMLSAWTRGRI